MQVPDAKVNYQESKLTEAAKLLSAEEIQLSSGRRHIQLSGYTCMFDNIRE